jgi:CRP-like cAMP-binding protein
MAGIHMFKHARHKVDLPAGEAIFAEGDPGDAMYVVLDGSVDIVLGDEVIETVGPGGIVGELALIDSSPRSAGAVAHVESQLARVDQKEFTFLVHEHPTFALQVMQVFADRIRRANASR